MCREDKRLVKVKKSLNLTFVGPCIVIYFYSKIKFILFWNNTVHISDGLSVHHQESKTVRAASGICCLLASSRRTCMTYT